VANLRDAVAPANFAPHAWQTPAQTDPFARGAAVEMSEDLRRVLALPRRKPLNVDDPTSIGCVAMVESEMRKYSLGPRACRCAELDPQVAAGKRECIQRLLPVQAWALREIALAGGLIGSIVVGAGKTVLDVMALLALDVPLGLLLIPPSLMDQIVIDYQLIAEHFRVPGLVVHLGERKHRTFAARRRPDGREEPTLHVLPYSRLSQPSSSDWIENLRPNAIIADECDALSDKTSARTLRLMRFYSGRETMTPEQRAERLRTTRFCGWTGSISDKSLGEYAHLMLLALRDASPLPIDPMVVEEWDRCVGASSFPCPAGALMKLCEPGESVRSGFRRRLAETLGVVVTTSSNVTVAGGTERVDLDVRERSAPPIPTVVAEALAKVRSGVRPDTIAGNKQDEEFDDVLEQVKCAREVACGMFYRWIFPRGEAESLIDEWYGARKPWNKELRLQKIRGEEHLDSTHHCEQAAMRAWGDAPKRADRPEWKAESWPRWRDVKDLVKPETQAVRLHPFLVEDAAHWGLTSRGIIWYSMVELAMWIREISGLTVHEGGPGAGARLRSEIGDRSIVASVKSHGRGRDGLQHLFDRQLIINVLSSGRGSQQLLGRLHRRGQRSATVFTEVYIHTEELRESLEQALARGQYVLETLGESQKLLDGWRED
jgi:hypothetical protein